MKCSGMIFGETSDLQTVHQKFPQAEMGYAVAVAAADQRGQGNHIFGVVVTDEGEVAELSFSCVVVCDEVRHQNFMPM